MIYQTSIKQMDELRYRVQARVLPGGLCQQIVAIIAVRAAKNVHHPTKR